MDNQELFAPWAARGAIASETIMILNFSKCKRSDSVRNNHDSQL
jgi:hypothetical protein